MRVVDRADLVRKELDEARAAGATVGLVPTMGFLHRGHASLIRRSVAENDLTAVTVFVNPLQFGDAGDLASYPRDLDHDLEVAAAEGADVVFAPPVDEMYPHGRPVAEVRMEGPPATGLEEASRPGHFAGVATVVAKLFNLAGPCRAYFGEKDFQQLAVVRRLVADLSFPVEVVACPTVREPDGLACSSRNARLSPAGRRAATVLYRALLAGVAEVAAGETSAARVRASMAGVVGSEPLARLDYAEVVNIDTLERLANVDAEAQLVLAAHVDGVRLIDNMGAHRS